MLSKTVLTSGVRFVSGGKTKPKHKLDHDSWQRYAIAYIYTLGITLKMFCSSDSFVGCSRLKNIWRQSTWFNEIYLFACKFPRPLCRCYFNCIRLSENSLVCVTCDWQNVDAWHRSWEWAWNGTLTFEIRNYFLNQWSKTVFVSLVELLKLEMSWPFLRLRESECLASGDLGTCLVVVDLLRWLSLTARVADRWSK